MKKLLIISGIVLFLAVSIAVSLLDGTTTLAEICGLNGEEQIVSVEMIPASPDTFRGTHTVYESGEVCDRAVSLFFKTGLQEKS